MLNRKWLLAVALSCGMMSGQDVQKQVKCLTDTPDQLRTQCVMDAQNEKPTTLTMPDKLPEGSLLLLHNQDLVVVPDCEDSVLFHGHSKAIKDIFPEECGHMIWPQDDRILKSAPGDPMWKESLEPPDVPAIQKTRPAPYPCNLNTGNMTMCLTGPEDYWTCADTSRILLTAEDGTHHCVKFK